MTIVLYYLLHICNVCMYKYFFRYLFQMAPGPKKKSFHTPRNVKNTQNVKNSDKKPIESNNDTGKIIENTGSLIIDSDMGDTKKYSKRSVESNWNKYEEPQSDPHADSMRGNDFEVLLSYSGGSGTQHKLQDEKDWEDECLNMKDISLNLQDLVSSMKCIPFHERINLHSVFSEKHIMNFISSAEKWKKSSKLQSKSLLSDVQDHKLPSTEPILNIIEEPDLVEDDDFPDVKSFVVQDKTESIINSLASNLSFKNIPEKEEVKESPLEEKKSEATSNDLDFLLSLNISSKLSNKAGNTEAAKSTNVDDWLNSILDD